MIRWNPQVDDLTDRRVAPPRRRRQRGAAVLAAIAVTVGSACSNSDDGSAGGSTATTAAPATTAEDSSTTAPADAERIVVTSAGTLLPTLQALGVSIVGAPFPDEPIPAALVTEEDLEGSSRSDFPTSRSSASPTSTRT